VFRLWPPELDTLAAENATLAARITEDFGGDDRPPEGCSGRELLEHQRASMLRMVEPHPDGRDEAIAGRPCRIFTPVDGCQGVILHFHGGGMAMGTPEMNDHDNAALSARLGVAVVSVGYRLAPEHPYPAAIDDAVAVADELERDATTRFGTSRLIIAGESAGATVAIGCLLRIREAGGIAACWAGAVLTFGLYDWGSGPSRRGIRPTDAEDTLDPESLARFADWYLPDRTETERREPQVSPAWADLAGLPPAFMTVGTADHLLDDTLVVAARSTAVGNDVDLLVVPDAPHGFIAAECAATQLYQRRLDAFVTRCLRVTDASAERRVRRSGVESGPDDAGVIAQFGRDHGTAQAHLVEVPVVLLGHAAADDDQIGCEEPVEVAEVLVEPGTPFGPAEVLVATDPVGHVVLGDLGLAGQVELAELGVGYEDAVDEQG
jgi:acetyl esterase